MLFSFCTELAFNTAIRPSCWACMCGGCAFHTVRLVGLC